MGRNFRKVENHLMWCGELRKLESGSKGKALSWIARRKKM